MQRPALADQPEPGLFSLLGTTYGGNGTSTFALPNLQGKVPVHTGGGLTLGTTGGEQNVSLTLGQLPSHTHPAVASSNVASVGDPGNAYWAQAGNPGYATAAGVTMFPSAIAPAGGGQPHDNMSPYLTLNFCIALQGIFPSRN